MGPMIRHCRECGQDLVFDQPHHGEGSCPDTADGRCLEWACTGCGGALFAGLPGPLAGTAGTGGLRPGRAA